MKCHEWRESFHSHFCGVSDVAGCVVLLVFRPSLYPPYDETGLRTIANERSAEQTKGGIHGQHRNCKRAHTQHAPIDAQVFRLVAEFSLLALFCFVGYYYGLQYSTAGALWIFLIFSSSVIDAFRNYYGHDLFYAALCALFFLVLRASPWSSLPFPFSLRRPCRGPSGRFTFPYSCMRAYPAGRLLRLFLADSRAPS